MDFCTRFWYRVEFVGSVQHNVGVGNPGMPSPWAFLPAFFASHRHEILHGYVLLTFRAADSLTGSFLVALFALAVDLVP